MTQKPTETELIAELLSPGEAPGHLDTIGARLLAHIVDRFRSTGEHPRRVIDALCQLEASDRDGARAAGSALIFTHLVEALSDSFEEDMADLYDSVFAQIIEYQRRRPEGRQLNEGLDRFGLITEDSVKKRRLGLRRQGAQRVTRDDIRCVIVFSRVTVGADVAITSVIIRKLRSRYTDARVLLVAPSRIRELFAGDSRIEILEAPYPRRGSLAERLSTWAGMMQAIGREVGPLPPEHVLWLDPDSRLTQLGLLPVARDENYRIFESRTYGAGETSNLGTLAARWMDETVGTTTETAGPYIRLSPAESERGRACIERLRTREGQQIVSVSFGVGGNEKKRSGELFESRLLLELTQAGHRVVLDRGIDSDRDRSTRALDRLRSEGLTVIDADEDNLEALSTGPPCEASILAWTGGLGAFSALIEASDLYIGYDSAFQHIAAALGIPVVAIVLGSPGTIFRHRWHPHSNGKVRVLPEAGVGNPTAETLIEETLLAARGLLAD